MPVLIEVMSARVADYAMEQVFDAAYVTLHVRVSNKTAFHLYRNTLGYECVPLPCLIQQPTHQLANVESNSGLMVLT